MKYKIYYQNNNKIKTIDIEAINKKALYKNNLYPNNVLYIKEYQVNKSNLFINENEKLELFYELKIMLEANLEFKYIIEILISNFKGINKDFLNDILNSINNGQNIYENIAQYKNYIGSSIIFFKIAQENSNFKDSISSMYSMIKIEQRIKNKVKSLLTYPTILLFTIVMTIFVLFIYVIPKFENIYNQFGNNLPYSTKLLLDIKYYITSEYFTIILLLIFLLFIIKILFSIYKYQIDKFIINKIPIFSKMYKNIIFYKLFLSISLQVNSKESFYNALLNSMDMINNIYLKSKLQYILKDIKNGKSIYYSFEKTNSFDLFVIRILKTAYYSNEYEKLLKNIVNIYESNINKDVNKFKTNYQPILIFIISSIVLWLVLAIMAPIWDLGSVIK